MSYLNCSTFSSLLPVQLMYIVFYLFLGYVFTFLWGYVNLSGLNHITLSLPKRCKFLIIPFFQNLKLIPFIFCCMRFKIYAQLLFVQYPLLFKWPLKEINKRLTI